MDETHLYSLFVILAGGLPIGLPFIFIKSIRVPKRRWAEGALLAFLGAVVFSVVVAVGGNCGFFETLLMTKFGCYNMPLANVRTVPVLNGLALGCLLLLVIELIRAGVSELYVSDKK